MLVVSELHGRLVAPVMNQLDGHRCQIAAEPIQNAVPAT